MPVFLSITVRRSTWLTADAVVSIDNPRFRVLYDNDHDGVCDE